LKYFDVPKYKVRSRPGRFLFNRLLISIVLGILLYMIIFTNYYLLDLSIPSAMNWLIIVGILMFVSLEFIWGYVKYSNYSYEFYEQKVVINDNSTRSIPYDDLKLIRYSSNLIDRWFKTGSVILESKDGKYVKLRYLENPNQAYTLMQKYVK
jgi:hypothetical protein